SRTRTRSPPTSRAGPRGCPRARADRHALSRSRTAREPETPADRRTTTSNATVGGTTVSRSTRAIAALVAPALVVTVLAGCAVHPSPEPTPLPRIPGTAEAASLSTFDGCEPLLEELHERSADVLSQPSP